MYRRQIDAPKGNTSIAMPSWFKHLCAETMCFASPVRHFGSCWADLDADDANTIILGTSRGGKYNLLVTAKRNDDCARKMCPQEVEYDPTAVGAEVTTEPALPPGWSASQTDA